MADDPMDKRTPHPETDPNERYIRLAELAHAAFSLRQQHGWKLYLSVWAGLGLAFWWCMTTDCATISSVSTIGVWIFTAAVFVLFAYLRILLLHGDETDKDFKHYYLARAEGISKRRPAVLGTRAAFKRAVKSHWFWSIILLTFALMFSASVLVTQRIKACGSQPTQTSSTIRGR